MKKQMEMPKEKTSHKKKKKHEMVKHSKEALMEAARHMHKHAR